MLIRLVFLLLLFPLISYAQQPPATPAQDRIESNKKRELLSKNSLVSQIPFRSAGPTVFGGRIVDLEVNPVDPTIFYAAYASGGLWKTEDNGISFNPIFEQEAVMTIGDIAVDWTNDIIWIGTGENNSSRSSYSGTGMYRSADGGKTWEHKGLPESHHVGRIILHPSDQNTLWVAVLGHLYSPNEERGVYKTTDGGATWKRTLYVDENSGAVDMVIDPADPNTLYAATWHRERRAWNFVEAGPGSGIHKSKDGGETWTSLTTSSSLFPQESVGRIGLTIAKVDGQTVLYSILDNQARRPEDKDKKKNTGLTKDDFRNMTKEAFVKLEEKDLKKFLQSNRFPKKYKAKSVIEKVRSGEIRPNALTEFLEDANSLLFDTPVIGAQVFRSDDEGKSWKKTHEGYLDDLFYSYGYYFGQIRVNPSDVSKIYIVGVPVLRSEDGGATFKSINGENVHVDHHALWVDPNRKGHLILGNDGGVNISYDDGDHWVKCNTPSVGQFYTVQVDMAEPYNIYGGLQDNGVWVGSSNYREGSTYWHNSGQYPYQSIMGGDGMQVAVDTRDNNTVYTGYQFGNYFRINKSSGQTERITPKHELGERPLRWNWQTPIHLSIHNQDILYMGSNKLHRSFNQGNDFDVISEDLTQGGRKGDVAYGTLTSIHESPLQFGVIYTGSDDGLVHITKDNGSTWKPINSGLPKDMWVTKIQASVFEKDRVYISLNGYRWDDFTAYLYRSDDYGTTWEKIGSDLPMEPINVVKEDPHQQHILYVGTDNGLYVSFNRGETFMRMEGGLPAVSVHDLVVHPKAHDLVIGTHGRSFYIADVTDLQKLNDDVLAKAIHLFEVDPVTHSSRWGNSFSKWRDASTPKLKIPVYLKTDGSMTITIKSDKGQTLNSISHEGKKGINYIEYDLSLTESAVSKYQKNLNADRKKDTDEIEIKKADNGKYYLHLGEYGLEIKKGGASEKGTLVVKERG